MFFLHRLKHITHLSPFFILHIGLSTMASLSPPAHNVSSFPSLNFGNGAQCHSSGAETAFHSYCLITQTRLFWFQRAHICPMHVWGPLWGHAAMFNGIPVVSLKASKPSKTLNLRKQLTLKQDRPACKFSVYRACTSVEVVFWFCLKLFGFEECSHRCPRHGLWPLTTSTTREQYERIMGSMRHWKGLLCVSACCPLPNHGEEEVLLSDSHKNSL